MTVALALIAGACIGLLVVDGPLQWLLVLPLMFGLLLLVWVAANRGEIAPDDVDDADQLHVRRKDAARCGEPDPGGDADWLPWMEGEPPPRRWWHR